MVSNLLFDFSLAFGAIVLVWFIVYLNCKGE